MSDTITETAQAIREMDSVTQTIFLAGIRAMKAGRLTLDTFEDRVTALVMCHRAGGEVTTVDLYFPQQAED